MNKQEIRKEIFSKLSSINNADRENKELLIKQDLMRLGIFKKAKVVMFYISTGTEVRTDRMIEETLLAKKIVVVPIVKKDKKTMIASKLIDERVNNNDFSNRCSTWRDTLEKGAYNIYEPKTDYVQEVDINNIDLAIVPGVAFDKKGNRLGRGAGYYDRFLEKLSVKSSIIGIAYKEQMVEKLPVFSHDVPVDMVISA